MNGSRQGLVDRLRGYALLGVIVVNAPFLVTSSAGLGHETISSTPDRLAALTTWVLFQGKAYLVFAFLFGYSLTIFLASATAKGLNPSRLYLQRLAALFVLGVGHALLLFPGDILVVYATLGLLLLALQRCRDRTLLVWAGGLFALQMVLLGLLAVVPSGQGAAARTAALDARLATGGPLATTRAHLELWPDYLVLMLLLQGALVGSMFCLGLCAGRRGLLRSVEPHEARWRALRRWGMGVGLPLQALSGWMALRPGASEEDLYLGLVLQYLTAPVLSAGLVAAIVLLPRRGLTRLVEEDGRMSLTIYLSESLVLTVLAVGWGFGLMGLSPAPTLLAAIGAWVGLLSLAHLWHRAELGTGPAERALRWLTHAGVAASGTAVVQTSAEASIGSTVATVETGPGPST